LTYHFAEIDAERRVLRLCATLDVPVQDGLMVALAEPVAAWPSRDGFELRLTEAGELHHVDQRPLPQARDERWSAIKAQRAALGFQPVPLRDFALDADAASRLDVMGAVMAMQVSGDTSRLWRCSDNAMRELTLADLLTVGAAIAARRQALIEASDTLFQQIQTAETNAEVDAVAWPEEPA
jgi:hypothetical protein